MAAPKKTVKPVAKAAETTTAPKVEVKKPVVPVAAPKAEEKKEAPKAEEKKEAAPKAAAVKKEAAPKAAAAKKETAPKAAAAKKEAAPKAAAAKKEAAPKAAPKAAAKKAPAKKAAKKAEMKSALHIQFSGKSYSQEELEKMAKDVWKYDLKQKARELTSIDLYVKPEENMVYYVMNQEFTGSFYI